MGIDKVPVKFVKIVAGRASTVATPGDIGSLVFASRTRTVGGCTQRLGGRKMETVIMLTRIPKGSRPGNRRTENPLVRLTRRTSSRISVVFKNRDRTCLGDIMSKGLLIRTCSCNATFSSMSVRVSPRAGSVIHGRTRVIGIFRRGVRPTDSVAEVVRDCREGIRPSIGECVNATTVPVATRRGEDNRSTLNGLVTSSRQTIVGASFTFVGPKKVQTGVSTNEIA